jgi:hypothetical protein
LFANPGVLIGNLIRRVIKLNGRRPGQATELIEGGIGGNPVDPGGKLRFAPECGQRAGNPAEDLLSQIFCFAFVHHTRHVTEYLRIKLLIDVAELGGTGVHCVLLWAWQHGRGDASPQSIRMKEWKFN